MKLLFSVFLMLASFSANAEKAGPLRGHWTPLEIADNVFVIHGPLGTPSPENQGFMNNPGFILTDKGVIVVDPGGSVQSGEMVLSEIEKMTRQPVIAVFDTHVHGDHWLGNQAVFEKYPDVAIYAHPSMIAEVQAGAGDEWIDMAMRMTKGAVDGTRVVNASKPIRDGETIAIAGLHFKILSNDSAHTHTDIMVQVVEKGVMFLGDNAAVNRVIRNEGSVKGNIDILDRAIASGVKMFVPGHGPSSQEAPRLYRDLLSLIYAEVKKGYEEDLGDFEMKPSIAKKASKWAEWDDFDRLLGKLINKAYLEIEAEDF